MQAIRAANLALRFFLELAMLAALGYWGYQSGQGPIAKIGLAIAAPLVAAVVWGLFIAPKASIQVPTWVWLGLQVVLFGCAIAGLLATGHPALAGAFLLALAINATLLYIWRE